MLSWQEYTNLSINSGLSVEQIRRNYTWYMWQYPWITRGGPSSTTPTSKPKIWISEMTADIPFTGTNYNPYFYEINGFGQNVFGGGDYIASGIVQLQDLIPDIPFGFMIDPTGNVRAWCVQDTEPELIITWTDFSETTIIWDSSTLGDQLDITNCFTITVEDYYLEGPSYSIKTDQFEFTTTDFGGDDTVLSNTIKAMIGRQGVVSVITDPSGDGTLNISVSNNYPNIGSSIGKPGLFNINALVSSLTTTVHPSIPC